MSAARGSRGSALAWSACLLLVLTVLLAGMSSIAGAYQRRGAREVSASHSYLAATGALEAVLSLLDGTLIEIPFERDNAGNAENRPANEDMRALIASALPILPLSEGSRVALTDFIMGEMTVDSVHGFIECLSPSQWRVSITAAYNGAEYTASALVALEITAAGEFREDKSPAFMPFSQIFHSNVIDTLMFTAENSLFSIRGAALYLGTVSAASGAKITLDGALFTRETLGSARSRDENRVILTDTGEISLTGHEFTGEMPGFGQVFLPDSVITRAMGQAISPGLAAISSEASIRAVYGAATLDLSTLPQNSRLYLFLQPGAELTLTGSGEHSLVYVYAPAGAKIIMRDGVSLRGAVLANEMQTASAKIEYFAPPDTDFTAETSAKTIKVYPAGAFDYKWSFVRYE